MDDTRRKLTVFVLGLRGFPGVQGGVETHAENLYPLIVEQGIDVICATRRAFQVHPDTEWRGVRLLPLWAPRSQYLEAIVHSIIAVLRAAVMRPDIVHIHAVGPALVTPLARLFGLRTVVTHHGPDYDREKWSPFAKKILRLGERAGMIFSSRRIVISEVIADTVRDRYVKDCDVIPNGVPLPDLDADPTELRQFGLESGRYALLVSRFVPEKRHIDLINAFRSAAIPGWKLALVGDADHPGEYVRELRNEADGATDVVLTGFQTGATLKSLYQYAGAFVLPSSHEGLPISLLEALSFGLPCIASAIPANRCVGLDRDSYFDLGDTVALADRLERVARQPWTDEDREKVRRRVAENYNWREISKRTAEVYRLTAR